MNGLQQDKREGININSIIKYPGAKWSIAHWIISHFPEHHSYLEPFFGSGAVFFNKPRSDIETINDLDGDVVNLFDCIRRNPQRLARDIYYTPYSREVYDKALMESPADPFEKALNFYIRMNMSRGCRTNGEKACWKNDIQGRQHAYTAQEWCLLPDMLLQVAERLRGVQIEHMPALQLIKRFNYSNVLIYCDPPYVLNARHGKQYKYEMDLAGHEELLKALLMHKGPVVISGYQTELYNDMLSGWNRYEKTAYSQVATPKTEVIWTSFEQPQIQLSFFAAHGKVEVPMRRNQNEVVNDVEYEQERNH